MVLESVVEPIVLGLEADDDFEADVIQDPAFGGSGCHGGFGKYHFDA